MSPSSLSSTSSPRYNVHLFEFYSGIGGWHQAFQMWCAKSMKAQRNVEKNDDERDEFLDSEEQAELTPIANLSVLRAFDINESANRVYRHNHPDVPIESTNIEHLKPEYFDRITRKALKHHGDAPQNASEDDWRDLVVWSLSPPCQPFTKGGRQQDIHDTRSNSFAHILTNILPNLEHKPDLIMVENVKNFEASQMRTLLLKTLEQCGYDTVEEYLTSPHTLLHWPNERTRYYLIACRRSVSSSNPSTNGDRVQDEDQDDKSQSESTPQFKFENHKTYLHSVDDASDLVAHLSGELNLLHMAQNFSEHHGTSSYPPQTIGDVLLSSVDVSLWIPDEVIQRLAERGYNFDIVHADSQISACFTKGYGCPPNKFVKGSGSLLSSSSLDDKREESPVDEITQFTSPQHVTRYISDLSTLRSLRPRRFHSTEISRLLGFPDSFEFCQDLSQRQRAKLLGNSIHVHLTSTVVLRGLRIMK